MYNITRLFRGRLYVVIYVQAQFGTDLIEVLIKKSLLFRMIILQFIDRDSIIYPLILYVISQYMSHGKKAA
jgi:hypothetical protein